MDSLRCIWCNRTEEQVSFSRKAHTIPQSLGGIYICDNVCNKCNSYFGSPHNSNISIEEVLREAFEITRFHVHDSFKERGKNKKYSRFKSRFFNFNERTNSVRVKPIYSLRPGFQERMARLFKRGLYKIFLEEYHRQTNQGFDDRYNFIREFARFDLNDFPVYYLRQKFPGIFISKEEFDSPSLLFTDHQIGMMQEFGFYEMRLFSHTFIMPVIRNYQINFDNYIKWSRKKNSDVYDKAINIIKFTDIDFTNQVSLPGK